MPQQTPGTPVGSFPYIATFGTSGGAFGLGFAPANYNAVGSANSLTPYRVPVYAIPAGFSSITPWGGPPAYDPNGSGRGTRDGTFAAGLNGVAEGISVFNGATPGVGTYTMNVQIPSTGGVGTVSATSALAAVTLLPPVPAPVITTTGSGAITVAYTLPPGVTGAYVQIQNRTNPATGTTFGTCTGTNATAPAFYTFWVTSSGTSTVQNSNAPSAGAGSTAVAACTGDLLRAWVIGFDYNHYALTYNGPLSSTYPQKPALPAQADVSISPPANGTAL